MARNKFQTTVKTKSPDLMSRDVPVKYFYYFLLAFTFLVYARSIGNEFAIDDAYVTTVDRKIQNKSSFKEIWTERYANVIESGEELNFGYRPIVKMSFAIDQSVFGNNPHMSHLINVLLYMLIVVLLFYLLRKIFAGYNTWVIFLIVVLYVAHPVNTEVVCSLKNRDILLSFLFSLLSLLLFLQYTDDKKWWKPLLALLLFALSMFSKVIALTFIVVIPLVLYYYKDIKIYKLLILFGVLLALSFVLRIMPRYYVEPSFRPKLYFENPLYYNRDVLVRISTGFFILLFYVKLLLFPHPLLFYYGYRMVDIAGWSNPWVWLSILIHLAIFIYAVMQLKKKTLLSFGILFYLVTISMFANFIRPPAGIVADRFMFAPLLGFCIALVVVIMQLYKVNLKDGQPQFNLLKSKVIIPFAVILLLFSVKTISRSADWKDTGTLLKRDIQYLEKSAKANYIYAGTLRVEAYEKIRKSGNIQNSMPMIYLAIDHWNNAIKAYPGYYDAYNMLGETYFMFLKDNNKAIEYLNKAIEVKPDFGLAYFNLGFIARSNKQYDTAVWYLQQAIKYSPAYKPFYLFMSEMYREMGNEEEAENYITLGKQSGKFNKERKKRKRRVEKNIILND